MSDFLKSAFDYFGSSGKTKGTNDLVGNSIEIGSQTFRVISTIAEGGFAIVFQAQDVKTQKKYALKRLISHDNDTNLEIMQEINILKKLSSHSNIIRLCTAASIGQQKHGHVGTDFLIVTELCTGGQVIQLMQRRNKPFPYNVTLQIFDHVCKAIEHMHSFNPPIIHRDLKVENLLISNRAVIKLCDFGSATTEAHYPDNSWTGLKRSEVQEEIEKHTTPMYRTPEMLDLYQNYPITQACDIWALGCVLYYFCCNKHPFEDSAKLAILNANYSIPANMEVNDRICGLICQILLIDPGQRLTISEIINDIRDQASAANVQLKPSIAFDKESLVHLPPLKPLPDSGAEVPTKTPSSKPSVTPNRPQPPLPKHEPRRTNSKLTPRPNSIHTTVPDTNTVIPSKSNIAPIASVQSTNDGKKVLGILKDGAGNFMKNIRDVSNKVMEQVSSSINKTDLDLIYVTSRIIMMPTPAETGIDLLTKDKIDDVHTFLEFRHPNQYFIYNLGLKLITSDKFKDRIIHVGFDAIKPPSLNNLVMVCMHQMQWLLTDSKNVVVIQCIDGRVASGINVMALFCFCRLVDTSSAAAEIVRFRRGDCQFTASQMRYADYICRLMRNIGDPTVGPDIPHNYLVKVTGIELQPVPVFNRDKTGVRLFAEIFNDYRLVYSTLTNYEDTPLFTYDHKCANIIIPNISVHGDLNIIVYHTRSNIVAKGKISAIKICETQLYCGYVSPTCTEISLMKNQLDNCDGEDDKYPSGFQLKVLLQVVLKDALSSDEIQTLAWNSEKFKTEIVPRMSQDDRIVPFSNKEEMQACMLHSGVKLPMKDTKPKQPELLSKPKKPESKDFFFTLDWTNEVTNEVKNEVTNDIAESSGQSSPESVPSPCHDNSNNNDTNYGLLEEKEGPVAVIGDLLGDFSVDDTPGVVSVSNNNFTTNGVDDLDDFFSGFPSTRDEAVKSCSNVDLFAAFTDSGSKDGESNLLFFESTNNDKSNSFMFDPFGQAVTNSSSTTDLSTHQQSRVLDWDTKAAQYSHTTNHPIIKPSNSTNCLMNMNISGQMRTSPSFNGTQMALKTDPFDNLNSISSNPGPSSKAQNKPITAPKPKLENRTFEKPETAQPKTKKDAFGDLLGDFKPTEIRNGSGNNGAKSIKDIRRETMSRPTDPEALKVLDWVEGREKNIRALLCSLPSLLWSDVRWPGVSMSELVTVAQVKKAYKNAIRCVHPDKWNNSEHENLAKMIMMELNEAMSEFECEKNAACT